MMSGNPLGLVVGFVIKLFRIDMDTNQASPMFDKIERVDPDSRPDVARQGMKDTLDECAKAGLRVEFMYVSPEISSSIGYGVVLTSEDPQILNQVLYTRDETQGVVTTLCQFSCVTFLENGGDISTGNDRKLVNAEPRSQDEHHPGKSVDFIVKRHRERIGACSERMLKLSPENIEATLIETNNKWMRYSLERGTMVPMTEDEVDTLCGKLGK